MLATSKSITVAMVLHVQLCRWSSLPALQAATTTGNSLAHKVHSSRPLVIMPSYWPNEFAAFATALGMITPV
ncbi:ammonium transporter, partial [Moniliophthora roreri]